MLFDVSNLDSDEEEKYKVRSSAAAGLQQAVSLDSCCKRESLRTVKPNKL